MNDDAHLPAAFLEQWEMSVRLRNCLANPVLKSGGRLKIDTIDDLCALTDRQLLGLRNFGRVCLRELKEIMAYAGLRLVGAEPSAVVIEVQRLRAENERLRLILRNTLAYLTGAL